jgi:hypothetical protein
MSCTWLSQRDSRTARMNGTQFYDSCIHHDRHSRHLHNRIELRQRPLHILVCRPGNGPAWFTTSPTSATALITPHDSDFITTVMARAGKCRQIIRHDCNENHQMARTVPSKCTYIPHDRRIRHWQVICSVSYLSLTAVTQWHAPHVCPSAAVHT